MRWEERLFNVFDDLEQQAEGLALQARDAEAGELARAHYAEVDLASRLHASIGARVELALEGLDPVRGVLERVGAGWCLVGEDVDGGGEWVLNLRHLLSARGLSDGAVAEQGRSVASRVGIGSALRSIAEAGDPAVVVRFDAVSRRGRLGRVGADFVELVEDAGVTTLLPVSAVAAVRRV
jgi:hypothetical protein